MPASRALERLHLEQLVRAGEIDEALAVLRSDLTTPLAHRRLVHFLEKHGRHREAFAAAETASSQYPDDALSKTICCAATSAPAGPKSVRRAAPAIRTPAVGRALPAAVTACAASASPADAVRVLMLIERVMLGPSSPYREALGLVADIASRMQADERSVWLQGLRVRFKSKRNFIRDLPTG